MDGARPHILVVDDHRDTADSTAMILALWGFDGEPRYGGPAALAAARRLPPCAVLLDVRMPGMDGFEFVEQFRRLAGCEHTPIVVVTGDTTDESLARGRDLGVRHYLLKPVDLDGLRAVLGRLILPRRPGPARVGPGGKRVTTSTHYRG